MTLDAVYITYWSLQDPLCQSQSLPVLRALARRGWRFGLITFEQPAYRLSAPDRIEAQGALEQQGIHWMPLRYHKRPAGLSTAFDILVGAWTCLRLAPGARVFHGRASVPGAIAYLASRFSRARFFNDADGPLSEEYVDAGVWKRGSIAHRLTAWAEKRFLVSADAVAVLSQLRRGEVERLTRGTPSVLPCAVDTAHFVPDAAAGARVRSELGLEGLVLVYSGKSGGWYRTDDMLDFVKVAQDTLGRLTLLVLTTEPAEHFEAAARQRSLRVVVKRARREEMPAYLSAGDAGLSFRLETSSQRACSPIKNGEYLACGLPVVTTPGAGDYSDLVSRTRTGVVVGGANAAAYRQAAEALRDLLADTTLRSRCRELAVTEVGLTEVVVPRYVRIYEELLGSPQRGGA